MNKSPLDLPPDKLLVPGSWQEENADIVSADRPTFCRNLELPQGMPPELAISLERKLVAWCDDPDEFPLEFGVRLYREIAETLRSL